MIVSHKLKLIALKTRKTGGTSFEIALSEHCGPDDIITPIIPDDEKTRQRLGFRGPQNFKSAKAVLQNHDPAQLVRSVVGDPIWNSYRKVAIERNPYDKALSLYWWNRHWALANGRPDFSVSQFLHGVNPQHLSNWSIYTIGGTVVLDEALRYEDFRGALAALGQRLGVRLDDTIRAKGDYRKDRRSYRGVLSNEDRQIIERCCSREIEYFGYEW
jgi:hypothetical protein